MFSRIQARNYRALKSIDQKLGPMQALVGPNASGKSTFLDVLGFLKDLMQNRGEVQPTVLARSGSFEKLIWHGAVTGKARLAFQLAIEANIPESVVERMAQDKRAYKTVRYELDVGLDITTNSIGIDHETLWLLSRMAPKSTQRELFPHVPDVAPTLFISAGGGARTILNKRKGGNDNYYPEGAKSYRPSFKLGRNRAGLANVPADEDSFPVTIWLRDLLEKGVQSVVLNSQIIRQPSPPGLGYRFQTDGSNLPWVIEELKGNRERFQDWLEHVRTALDDVVDIETVEREEDRHRYLVITYKSGAKVPSWLVSDGTLRLLALTIPAYLDSLDDVFLIEEPENGIHPSAIEPVIQSLSSIYDGQVIVATHSPVAINLLDLEQILCFAKDAHGAVDVVSGAEHPALRLWKMGDSDLGVLFAAGVLS